jgi:spore maturation protein CgeB
MKILITYPGKLHTVPMGVFSEKALKHMGHEVYLFDLTSNLSEKILRKITTKSNEECYHLNSRFRDKVENIEPDLVLVIFGFDISIKSLEFLRQRRIVSACWWLNDPFQFNRSLEKAPYYDFMFTNSMGSVESYKESNIAHVSWLPTACDPDVHKRVAPINKYKSDVCFAGDWSALREQWCLTLSKHFNLRIFGPWKKKLKNNSPLLSNTYDGFFSPKEMAQIFASSKVVFNIHSWYGNWNHGTNPRLFEAAGCGAYQVVDWKEDIPHLFNVPSEISIYKDHSDLIGIVRDLIDSTDVRKSIGSSAQKKPMISILMVIGCILF